MVRRECSFAGLDQIIRDRSEKSGIGFGAQIHSKTDNPFMTEYLSDLEPEDRTARDAGVRLQDALDLRGIDVRSPAQDEIGRASCRERV